MTTRTDRIDQIIASRKPIAEKTEKTIERLKSISSALQNCGVLLQNILGKDIDLEQKDAIRSRLTELKRFTDESIPERIRELGQLHRRFNRATLNIGVVGNAGQGKSTLLQRLTGLSDDEIPTGAKGDCTGAAAIIENCPVTETYADIEFYSEDEFLKLIVAPYYRMLDLPQPSSLMEFEEKILEEVRKDHYDEVRFLESLQQGLSDYRFYLGENGKRIGKNEIRKYTAKSDQNGSRLSIWAAVKSVKVYCRFPGMEHEKISVGDTPGLGDRSVLDAEEQLMKDFGRNIDAVIMLRKVKERGIRKEDIRLYSLIKEAIPELPAEKWSYFMVNVFAVDRQSPTVKESLEYLPQDFKDSSLKDMQEYIELNCSDRNAVEEVFNRILDGIATNQEHLDNMLYGSRFEKCKQLMSEIEAFAGQLVTLFPRTGGDSDGVKLALALFHKEVWTKLGRRLSELVKKYKAVKNDDSQDFLANLDRIKANLEITPGLPSTDKVEDDESIKGLLGVFNEQCQETRRLVIEKFEGLDEGFRELFDRLRDEAERCFTDENGGKLGNVLFEQEKGLNWWNLLTSEIAVLGQTDAYRETARRIGKALHRFTTSSLSFRETLLPRIIPHFDCLVPGDPKNKPFLPKEFNDPQEVIDCIDSAAKHATEKAIEAVRSLSQEPSMALYAAIEELRDAVIRTSGFTGAEHVWGEFYAEHRTEIWPDHFKAHETAARFRQNWDIAVSKLKETVK